MTTDVEPAPPAFDKESQGPDECPSCRDYVEEWWNYCAMCGWYLTSGEKP